MPGIKTLDNKVKFLKLTLFTIGLAYFVSYIITILDQEFYILLKQHLSFYLLSSFSYLYLGILLNNISYQFTVIYRFIITSIYFHTYLFCLLHCNISNVVFLHFIPICIATLMIFKYQIVIVFSILAIGFSIVSKNINAYFYKIDEVSTFNKETIQKFETITIIYTLFFFIYILYYYIKFKKNMDELTTHTSLEPIVLTEEIVTTKEETNLNKFELLYKEIINYFEN